jgi:hypothetical protein
MRPRSFFPMTLGCLVMFLRLRLFFQMAFLRLLRFFFLRFVFLFGLVFPIGLGSVCISRNR